MKKNFLIFLILVLYGNSIKSQTDEEKNIIFDTTVYDFGKIIKNSNAECEFTFQNKGKLPVVITEVKASCGCTVPFWPKDPIMPGSRGSIKVKYNTSSIGLFNKSIVVHTNDKKTSTTLYIKGEVVKK